MLDRLLVTVLTVCGMTWFIGGTAAAQYGTNAVACPGDTCVFSASAGETVAFLDESGEPQLRITFADNVAAGVIVIREYQTRPASVPAAAPGTALVYREVNIIDGFSNGDIASAVLVMNVSTAELGAVNAAPDNIAVYRYSSQWDELPTSLRSASDQRLVFEGQTPGFSVFALAAKPGLPAAEAGSSASDQPAQPIRLPDTGRDDAASPFDSATLLILGGVFLVGAGTLALRRLRRAGR